MLISVIVPNYNHANYLKQRIDSILHQSYQNFEIIILDDCSTDNSRNIIEEYRDHSKISKIIYNETNSGSTFKQWNKGVGLAGGELIWIAESDDFASLDLLQNLKLEFDLDAELGIAYAQSNMVNENNEVTGSWLYYTNDLDPELFKSRFKLQGKDYLDKFLIYRNTIPNASAVLFRKRLYEQIGGADINVANCSDWLTWVKMSLISNIAYIPQHFNNFRYHDNSVIAQANKTTVKEYIGKYEIIMRILLHKFLLSRYRNKKEFKVLIKKNYHLILKRYKDESFYYSYNPSWTNGLKKTIKISFSSIKNFLLFSELLVDKIREKV